MLLKSPTSEPKSRKLKLPVVKPLMKSISSVPSSVAVLAETGPKDVDGQRAAKTLRVVSLDLQDGGDHRVNRVHVSASVLDVAIDNTTSRDRATFNHDRGGVENAIPL